jgi:hypothetical protein
MLVGHVDLLQRLGIAGWAGDTDDPDARVDVIILLNGQECARVRADMLRSDVQALGTFGDGCHGFEYAFGSPLSALRSYEVRVHFAATNALVPAGRATLPAEPVLFAEPLSPILVSSIEPGDAGVMLRALGEHQQIIIADLPGASLQVLSYYARAAEVLNSPGNEPPGLEALQDAADNQVIGRNPFHHQAFQPVFRRRRLLHEFMAQSAARTIGTAFKSVVVDLYLELARNQNKHDVHHFAERSDLFDVTVDFARTAFRQTTNIVLTRDLRDIYCAARGQWFASHTQIVRRLRRIADRMRWLGRVHRDDTIFVKFEDLLAMPDQVLGEVWNVLGVSPVSRHFTEETVGLRDAREAAAVGRWKVELDIAEMTDIEREFGDDLRLFGYEPLVGADLAPA